jgi:membrane associated rhomboid family serine protease
VMVHPASDVPTLGASGAISGVLGAYLLRYPRALVHTLILPPLPIVLRLPAFFFLGYWFVIQWLQGNAALAAGLPERGGTAWFAHVGGFVVGMVLILVFQPRRRRPRPPRHEYPPEYYGDFGR